VYVTRHGYNFVKSVTEWRVLAAAMVTGLEGEILTHI
jgi:hypothetical protein